jgi:hypothetical protein
MRVVLVLAMLGGCASGTFEKLPTQERAEQLIWHGLYGVHDYPPPPVEWISWDDDWQINGRQMTGLTWAGWKVQVRYFPRQPNVTTTTLFHEWLHYLYWLRTGDVDPEHFRADWSLVGKADLISAANNL